MGLKPEVCCLRWVHLDQASSLTFWFLHSSLYYFCCRCYVPRAFGFIERNFFSMVSSIVNMVSDRAAFWFIFFIPSHRLSLSVSFFFANSLNFGPICLSQVVQRVPLFLVHHQLVLCF